MRAWAVMVVLLVMVSDGIASGQSERSRCMYGRLYWDRDKNGAFTPLRVNDPMVEWLPRIPVEALSDGEPVASSVTRANGGYAVCAPSGVYDLRFGGQFTVPGIQLGETSVDVGETAVWIQRGDINRDLRLDKYDLIQIFTRGDFLSRRPATWGEGDFNLNGVFDILDMVLVQESKSAGLYIRSPEPAAGTMAAIGAACLAAASRRRGWRRTRSRG